jgi:hypothetical protein
MEDEKISHKTILLQIQTNTDRINRIANAVDRIRHENEPVRQFFEDMATAARFGRAIRAIFGWLVVIGGAIAVVWVSVANSFHNG